MKIFLYGVLLMLARFSFAGPNDHLVIAIKDNSYQHVKQFLNEGADPKARTLPPKGPGMISVLELACRCSADIEIIELLIEKGADPNEALFFVAHSNDVAMADFLVSKGADVKKQENIIAIPVARGLFNMAKFLLEHGANVNQEFCEHRPLMYAVFSVCLGCNGKTISYNPSFEIIELLVNQGVDPSLPVYDGKDIYYYLNTVGNISDKDKQKIKVMFQGG